MISEALMDGSDIRDIGTAGPPAKLRTPPLTFPEPRRMLAFALFHGQPLECRFKE